MAGLNSVSVVGRAGRDAENRYLENGSSVSKTSICVSGYNKEKDFWIEVVVWGKQAETFGNYVKKGTMIGVVGRLEQEAWTDRTSGKEQKKMIINVSQFQLISSGAKQSGQGGGSPQSQGRSSVEQRDPIDDEIPF